MTIADVFPFIMAALMVVIIIVIKVSTMRTNARRKAEGKKPLTEEQKIVNVIDWTRR